MLNRTLEMVLKEIDWDNPIVPPPAIYKYTEPIAKTNFVEYVTNTIKANVPDITTDPEISEHGRLTKLEWTNDSGQKVLEVIIFWATQTDTIQHYTGLFYFKRTKDLNPQRQFKFKFIGW